MNHKLLIILFAVNITYLSLCHTGDCFQPFKHDSYFSQQEERPILRRQQFALTRQMPFISTILTGPLMLAAVLFALPLIPSMVMAPLALAGIPPALNVLSNLVSGVTSGKPLSNIFSTLTVPSQATTTTSGDPTTSEGAKPVTPVIGQLNTLRSIAKIFRAAISRRYMINNGNPNANVFDIVASTNVGGIGNETAPDLSMLPEKVVDEGETSVVNNIENLPNLISNVTTTETSITDAEKLVKSLRGMDAVYSSIRDIYSVIRNGLRRYEITDSDCQSRIVCEIHQKIISHNKMLKTFSLNAIDLLSLEKHIDSWNTLNEKSKRTIKFYIQAAKTGFADKDCNKEFNNCPTLSTRSRMLRNLLLGNRHLFGKL